MATAVHMDCTLPGKQDTSLQMLFVDRGCAYVGHLCRLCNCLYIKFTETCSILEILLLASYVNTMVLTSERHYQHV